MTRDGLVLVTGATGFIGGATLAHLAETRPSYDILALARGSSLAEAESRIIRSVARFNGAERTNALSKRWRVIVGDLQRPQFLEDSRLERVTHVLHLAANTSFVSVNGVRRTNLYGALTFAHRMRRVAGLRRFLYVGTAYICGTNPPRVAKEDDYPDFAARHIVEYTRSKAECEALLKSSAPELPLIVARPSVVIGHTRLGCLPSASIFWFYRAVHQLDLLNCSVDLQNDVVPVDYAAEALSMLLLKPSLKYGCYHISAGEIASVSWREIGAAFAASRRESREEPYRETDFETIRREKARLSEILGPGDSDHLINALELYYRFCDTSIEVFDNNTLLAEGMPPPPKFTSYLELCETTSQSRSIFAQMLDDE